MNPEDVGPPSKVADLDVVYTSPDGDWSLATMTYEGNWAIGFRWNGDINNPHDKGYPNVRGQGAWCILPGEIGEPLVTLAKLFKIGYDANKVVKTAPE